MELTAPQIRYLLVIRQLNNSGVVRSTDIADSLAVSRPSVHRMIAQLAKMNLVIKEKYSYISITEKGQSIAQQYYDGFFHISAFLQQNFNISLDTAKEGALAILSRLDAIMLEDLCKQIYEKLRMRETEQVAWILDQPIENELK